MAGKTPKDSRQYSLPDYLELANSKSEELTDSKALAFCFGKRKRQKTHPRTNQYAKIGEHVGQACAFAISVDLLSTFAYL